MSKKYELVPYKSIGEFVFGMNRYDIQQILGNQSLLVDMVSQLKTGFLMITVSFTQCLVIRTFWKL